MSAATDGSPLASLYDEHRLIGVVLDAFETFTDRFDSSDAPDGDDLGQFTRFFTDFAESVHQYKEEEILLPALVRAGCSWDLGPISQVREEHNQERYLLRVLHQAAAQEQPWSRGDRRHHAAAMRAFIEFQRAHIAKEEDILYPIAVERLSKIQLTEVCRQLAAFDCKRFETDERTKLKALANRLAERERPAAQL